MSVFSAQNLRDVCMCLGNMVATTTDYEDEDDDDDEARILTTSVIVFCSSKAGVSNMSAPKSYT